MAVGILTLFSTRRFGLFALEIMIFIFRWRLGLEFISNFQRGASGWNGFLLFRRIGSGHYSSLFGGRGRTISSCATAAEYLCFSNICV